MNINSIPEELPVFGKIQKDLAAGRCVQLSGCVPGQTENFISALAAPYDFGVIVTWDEQRALELLGNYMGFSREVYYYPALDPMFYKADIHGSFLSEQRMEVVKKIYENDPCVIVTTPQAFGDELTDLSDISSSLIVIQRGGTLDEQELAEKLVSLGYENESQVQAHGDFSIRGGIVDIFPFAESAPYRIDLFGDEVESVKIFDIESQRSISEVNEVKIFPDGSSAKATGSTFLDYFRNKNAVFFVDEPARIQEVFRAAEDLNKNGSGEEASDEKAEALAFNLSRTPDLLLRLSEKPCCAFSVLGGTADDLKTEKIYSINAKNIPSYNGRFFDLVEDLKKYRKDGWRVLLIAAGESRRDSLVRNLADNEIALGEKGGSDIQAESGSIRVGFEYPDIKFSLITEVDIFGAKRTRKKRRRFNGDPIKDFSDLNVGDFVVHEQHGVGIYEGIERIKVDGTEKDFMKISYANNASLYVLATQFDKIQKYGGAEGTRPKLNRLGSKEWTNTKERVKAAVKDIAEDLVNLYAERQMKSGYRYGQDTVWQREFEDSFEYEETQDQLDAIEAVKADMESYGIMDRLICGDVGFGKTEVAIRAAFKAVQEGRQVAFLTPTTILAQQHYNTITKRMENYPVGVRMLSRFTTPKEQKETLAEMSNGTADIVVGTHRLLSKDIKFKDLGLLIVDEEQRFGVTHKEKIKNLRKDVDVLTLSATPIPRTLHMSLSGIRDMSLLTEPPVDRVPIQTYVMEYSDEAVKEAILREIRRGGQVYYVYNRTASIATVAETIQTLVPGARVAFAHGQMASRELEQIMYDFVAKEIDVLVSTTIVETGLDIPNVNTIIIHDADNFGLSQLYQLRGRVGRSNRTAYAFLLYKKDKLIREVAEKRLRAIREFSDLGSGIKIAMRDLEIRGAGNILGAEQSGHMEAVGYELYCKMLNEAVARLKGEKIRDEFDTTVDLNIDGYIPAEYIPNEYEKLNMYKKISTISSGEERDDIKEELLDRFGELPRVTENLLTVALIKSMAHRAYVVEVTNTVEEPYWAAPKQLGIGSRALSGSRASYKITMFQGAPIDTEKMPQFLMDHGTELRFVAEKNPYFVYSPLFVPTNLKETTETLGDFFEMLEEIIDRDR